LLPCGRRAVVVALTLPEASRYLLPRPPHIDWPRVPPNDYAVGAACVAGFLGLESFDLSEFRSKNNPGRSNARVSTDYQTPALQLAALKKARMQNHFQRRWNIRSHDEAPCPSPLPEEARTRRHAHRVEAGPIRPRFARPDNDARRPETPGREIPFAHGGNRHRDAEA
jgi:hypothetical protein